MRFLLRLYPRRRAPRMTLREEDTILPHKSRKEQIEKP
jgi:hypothetical protein